MQTFEVDVGGKTYEVDAPDEKTAWAWANKVHQTGSAQDSLSAVEPKAPAAKPYDVPAGVASAMNIGQALTFGFGDEIAGVLGADKARYRQTLKDFKQEYPGSALLGEVSGSMLLPGGAGKLFANAPLRAAAATGAATGILQGAGDAETIEKIPSGAAVGGVGGAIAAPFMLGMARPASSVMSALATRVPGVGDAIRQRLADRLVVRALERDQVPVDQLGQRLRALGPEARVGDMGETSRGALDLQANLPGQTANELETLIRNRIAGRPERLDPIVNAVNGGVRSRTLQEAIEQQQRNIAAPLYQRAHRIDIMPTANLSRDLEAARRLGAFSEAEKRSLANPDNGPFTLDAAQQYLGKGRVAVRDIDHIKQGLDSLIEANTDAVTGKVSGYGRDLVMLKKRILSEVDNLVPDYRAAREAFSGQAALQTAMTKGKAFWNEKADRMADTLADMTAGEQQAFRIGAAEVLREKIGSPSGQNQLMDMWKNRNVREKLQQLLGNDVTFADVQRLLNNEVTLKQLERLGVGRNSRTMSREANAENQSMEAAADAVSLGAQAAKGNWIGLAQGLMRQSGRLLTPEPVRNEIGRTFMSQHNPALIQRLREAQDAMQRERTAAALAAGVAGGRGTSAAINP